MKKHDLEDVPLSEDVLTLSFLDVLSCGLGASMCLFLVFSAMPHLGSQAGAGPAQGQHQAAAGDAMFGALKRSAAHAVVEVEVRIGRAQNCELSDHPWDNSFRSARALRFPPVSVDNGQTRLYAAHFESASEIRNPVHFRIGPPRLASADSAIEVKVDLFVGGSRETFPAGDGPAVVRTSDLHDDSDLLRIDMSQPLGRRLSLVPKYESRGTR